MVRIGQIMVARDKLAAEVRLIPKKYMIQPKDDVQPSMGLLGKSLYANKTAIF